MLGVPAALVELAFLILAGPFLLVSRARPRVLAGAVRLADAEVVRLRLFGGVEVSGYDGRRALRYLARRWPIGVLGGLVLALLVFGAGIGVQLVWQWGRGMPFDEMEPTVFLVLYVLVGRTGPALPGDHGIRRARGPGAAGRPAGTRAEPHRAARTPHHRAGRDPRGHRGGRRPGAQAHRTRSPRRRAAAPGRAGHADRPRAQGPRRNSSASCSARPTTRPRRRWATCGTWPGGSTRPVWTPSASGTPSPPSRNGPGCR